MTMTISGGYNLTNLAEYEKALQNAQARRSLDEKYFGTGTGNVATNGAIGAGSGSATNIFGGADFNSLAGDAVNRAKDLALFRQQLDRRMGNFSFGLRDKEATRDFGFNTKLQGQQIAGTQALENTRQGAETLRLDKTLGSQHLMQQKQFDQDNLFRANSAALAMKGFRGY